MVAVESPEPGQGAALKELGSPEARGFTQAQIKIRESVLRLPLAVGFGLKLLYHLPQLRRHVWELRR